MDKKIKNIEIVKKIEGDKYYLRNLKFYNNDRKDSRIANLIYLNNIKSASILEIGCANGKNLFQYQQLLKAKSCVGIDLSSKAIKEGKKKFKSLKLYNLSSLELNKLNSKFDLIICGFFLYLLDREEIFNQFGQIYKYLNPQGYLIIEDFDPLFKHTNRNIHQKNLKSFKMSYDNFLQESGLFKLIYKLRNNHQGLKRRDDKKNFKSSDTSLSLFKKIDYIKEYPQNV
jgi:ubiquinone/menaquinone biosynthesis C-methylase UbiE